MCPFFEVTPFCTSFREYLRRSDKYAHYSFQTALAHRLQLTKSRPPGAMELLTLPARACTFAFPCSMTMAAGKHPAQSSPPEPPSKRPDHVPRRRRSNMPPEQFSALARKYRASINEPEENLLVGGDSKRAQQHRHFARSSRFPAAWSETVQQITRAVSLAALEGYKRIRIDLRNPELVAPRRAAEASAAVVAAPAAAHRRTRPRSSDRIALLMDACNATLRTLLRARDELPGLGCAERAADGRRTPPRATLFFNSKHDALVGAPLLAEDLRGTVDLHTLGDGNEFAGAQNDFSIVLCPSNTQSNPSHIELVELVHYSNWNRQNLIVIMNPSLIALTRHGSLDDEPRPPSFLSDYLPSYYIDPVAYIAKNATGALLCCFPRKWEMYLLKSRSDENGFRLICEQNNRPSREKLKCEFSWRADELSDVLVE